MATRLQKMLWTILCGSALGIAGCWESDDQTVYGPPPDASADADDDAADAEDLVEEEPIMTAYGPAPEYGPPFP